MTLKQITFTAGSDDVSYFRIETTEFNDNGALKSNGLSIQLKEDPSVSGGYIGFTTEDPVNGPEVEIFKISFSYYRIRRVHLYTAARDRSC